MKERGLDDDVGQDGISLFHRLSSLRQWSVVGEATPVRSKNRGDYGEIAYDNPV